MIFRTRKMNQIWAFQSSFEGMARLIPKTNLFEHEDHLKNIRRDRRILKSYGRFSTFAYIYPQFTKYFP